MEVTTQARHEILEDAIREYLGKGYTLVKKDNNRAFLKRRAKKNGLLKFLFPDIEKVFLYVDSSGDVSTSHA
jgi:hypothetical protein